MTELPVPLKCTGGNSYKKSAACL